MNKKNKWVVGIVIVLVLAIIGVYGTQFAVTGVSDVVWIPELSSVWCSSCDIGEQTYSQFLDLGFNEEKFVSYNCPKTGDYYIPKGCNFEIETSGGIGEIGVYVCNKNIDKNIINSQLINEITPSKSGNIIEGCIKYGDDSFPSDVKKNILVAESDILYLATEQDTDIKYDWTPYCLRTLERGQLTSKNGCSVSLLLQNVKDLPDGVKIVPFAIEDAIENVVIGYQGYVDNVNVIIHPVTKQSVFLQSTFSGKIESCEIKKANDGKFYVDTNSCKIDKNFKCLPSLPPTGMICKDGTSLIPVKDGSECYGSGLIGYKVLDEKKCSVFCNNGKQSIGSCIDIIGYNEGKIEPIEGGENKPLNLTPLYIILAIGFIAIIMVLIAKKRR